MALRSQRRFIGLSDVQSGMMIQFNYKKESGGSGNYIVLVVDPNRKNERAKDSQLHGFVIDQLSDKELVDFFASLNETTILEYENKRESVVKNLNTDEAYQRFKSSKYVKDRSYRTFNLGGMSSIRQILIGSIED